MGIFSASDYLSFFQDAVERVPVSVPEVVAA